MYIYICIYIYIYIHTYCGVPKVFPQDVVTYTQTPFGSGAPVQCFYSKGPSRALAKEDFRIAKPVLVVKEF